MGTNPIEHGYNQAAQSAAIETSAFTKEPNPAFQEAPGDGINPDLTQNNREEMEAMANTDSHEQTKRNTPKRNDPFTLVDGDHTGNIIKRARKFFHGAGNSIMWSMTGLGALLFLGLGWRKIGGAIALSGLGTGYLLKNKIANAGLGKDPHKELVKQINDSDFPKEYKLAMLEMVKDAYKSQNQNTMNHENVKAHVNNTLLKVRDLMTSLAQAPGAPNNQNTNTEAVPAGA